MRLPSSFVPPMNAPAGPGRAKLGRGEAAPRSDYVWLRPRLAPVCSGPVIANCPENAEERSISETKPKDLARWASGRRSQGGRRGWALRRFAIVV
eukprot:COSAG06_NODE_3042_length_5924_cov_7.213562_7_plen_95_part_00